ncbi:MAG: hypothetical protein K9W43_02845 [Candidatus Thorarchaeota archaeon]|nr:hypothetical protein [Candidatus Thorarchaeota archaeon]
MSEERHIERIKTLHYIIGQIQLLTEKSDELKLRLEQLEQQLSAASASDSSDQSSSDSSPVSKTLEMIVDLEQAITELERRVAALRKY